MSRRANSKSTWVSREKKEAPITNHNEAVVNEGYVSDRQSDNEGTRESDMQERVIETNAGHPPDGQTENKDISIDIQGGGNETNAGHLPNKQTESEGSREIDMQVKEHPFGEYLSGTETRNKID